MKLKLRVCLVLLFLVPGCFHVSLRAPKPTASGEKRVAAYQRLRPQAEIVELRVRTSDHVVVDNESTMILVDGTTVRHADDLLPVIDAESPAAAQARRSGAARGAKWLWMIGGTLVASAGMMVAYYGFEAGPVDEFGLREPDNTLVYGGFAAALVGGLAGTLGYMYYDRVEKDARRAAFYTYDAALQQRLRVCVDGLQVVACGTAGAPGQTY